MIIHNDLARRDKVLGPWLGERITIKGVYERYATRDRRGTALVVCLAQDVEVTLPNLERHDIGHVWIQHAETMKELREGDRFTATCRISTYAKEGENHYNLTYPNQIQCMPPPTAWRPSNPHDPPSTNGNGVHPQQPICCGQCRHWHKQPQPQVDEAGDKDQPLKGLCTEAPPTVTILPDGHGGTLTLVGYPPLPAGYLACNRFVARAKITEG